MAINMSIAKHNVCFPSKLLAGNGGEHIYNIVIKADTDNGTIVSRGDYVSFDQYEAGTAPTSFEGVIREQAADGNWYVEVVTPADAILIYEVPVIAETYDARFTDIANFYNAASSTDTKTVRGYALAKGDIYELSPSAFTGKPTAGKSVTVSGQKHVVGA